MVSGDVGDGSDVTGPETQSSFDQSTPGNFGDHRLGSGVVRRHVESASTGEIAFDYPPTGHRNADRRHQSDALPRSFDYMREHMRRCRFTVRAGYRGDGDLMRFLRRKLQI